MTPQTLAALTAAFLRSTRPLQVFGWILCLTAAGGLLLATIQGAAHAQLCFGMALAGGLALAWYALRIRFDVAAFGQIAAQPDMTEALRDFDAALGQLGLRQSSLERDLPQRARAAKRLAIRLATVVCGQLILLLTGFYVLSTVA